VTEPHVEHDDLIALALQEAEPEERARLSMHLAGCARCRGEYAGWEDAVQRTLAAAPSIAPPGGFSGRVLGAMGLSEPAGTPAPRRSRWKSRWNWMAVAAAALVIGLAVGIGGTLAATTPPPPVASVPGAATSASALLNRSGEPVGTAGLTTLSGRGYLLISVTRARPGAAYECIVVGADGQRRSAGTWTLDAGYGATEASGSWVVEAPPGKVARIELTTRSGAIWARADF
jgi:hypothetical protein